MYIIYDTEVFIDFGDSDVVVIKKIRFYTNHYRIYRIYCYRHHHRRRRVYILFIGIREK